MSNDVPEKLFQMRTLVDDPRFDGFGMEDQESQLGYDSIRDDMTPGYYVYDLSTTWEQPRLSKTWKPPVVKGRVAGFNDFPCIGFHRPVFSQRAVDGLDELLTQNGELLPLKSELPQKYYFYNITTISHALDLTKSKIRWLKRPYDADEITYFAFDEAKLKGLSIFRIHQCSGMVIVTDSFVRRVQELGLNGFDFDQIWPFPKSVNWMKHAKTVKAQQRQATNEMKAHTFVIILDLKGEKLSPDEKKLSKVIEDQLDAQLLVGSLDSTYWGTFEGRDVVDGTLRLFVTCPDVDRLYLKLEDWITRIEWPHQRFVFKRYGDMYDVDAREEEVRFKSKRSK